ncbi:MAG: PEP-CTERM sorting domain-containing protein [Betaproteobacteria bacterium]|nr:PEP-CTERM sorting domain-containing protein [Betaproteobacteria bacterium]
MKTRLIAQALAGCALSVAAAGSGAAVTVLYSATDIADQNGQDLWQYTYVVQAGVALNQTVDIAFDHLVHSPLDVLSSSVGWFAQATPSDPGLAADGHVTILNADGTPDPQGDPLPATIEVLVERFAAGPVGSQPFEHFDDSFNTLGTGATAPVPEPGTWAMLLGGLALLAGVRISRRA